MRSLKLRLALVCLVAAAALAALTGVGLAAERAIVTVTRPHHAASRAKKRARAKRKAAVRCTTPVRHVKHKKAKKAKHAKKATAAAAAKKKAAKRRKAKKGHRAVPCVTHRAPQRHPGQGGVTPPSGGGGTVLPVPPIGGGPVQTPPILGGGTGTGGSGGGTGTGTGGTGTGGGGTGTGGGGDPTNERVDLISNNDFEGDDSNVCFEPGSTSDGSVATTTSSPIAGSKSLLVNIKPFGRIDCGQVFTFEQGPVANAVTVEGDLRIDNPTAADRDNPLTVCAIVYYDGVQEPVDSCTDYTYAGGNVVHVSIAQDAQQRRLAQAYFEFRSLNVAYRAELDNAHLWIDEIPGSAGPQGGDPGGGGGSGGGGSACDSAPVPDGPPVAGSPCDENEAPSPTSSYRPAPLQLAASHPYISLNDYKGATNASPIGTAFKNYVDTNIAGNHTEQYTPADAVIEYVRSGDVNYLRAAISEVDAEVNSENAALDAAVDRGDLPDVASDDYLDIGGVLEEMAFAYDYGMTVPGLLSDAQQRTWLAFGNQALSNLWSQDAATWNGKRIAGSNWAINDPGDNYYYSFLKATEMWALATDNHAWMDFLQQYKFPLVEDYAAQLMGGGSREGTGYGVSQRDLFEDARLWQDSTGEVLPNVQRLAIQDVDYWVNATVPTLDMFAAIGDLSRESMPNLFDYHENLVREGVIAALRAGDTATASRGLWWIHHNSVNDLLSQGFTKRRALIATSAPDVAPTALTYAAPGVGQYFARSSWATDATWLNFTAGPYDQSHAHMDQGAFQLYRNTWLSATSNIFSDSGLEGNGINGELGVEISNVLRFQHGTQVIDQNNGTNTMTADTSGGVVRLHGDLTHAYSRSSSEVRSWTRDLTFQGNALHVHDDYAVGTGVTATFQLHTPVKPVSLGNGVFTAGRLTIRVDPSYTFNVVDMRPLNGNDFESGWRLDLTSPTVGSYDVDLTANP